MHIAIDGMDGSGKTSQAECLAKWLNCEFIPKSFHEMKDTSGKYDNFITISEFSHNTLPGVYGLRKNYFLRKKRGQDIVTDRFYTSNYWSRAETYSMDFFKKVSVLWGRPDIMILLYASPSVLYERIYKRNPEDKDLWKADYSAKAYSVMKEFISGMSFKVLFIDTTGCNFEKTQEIIRYAVKHGIEKCAEVYSVCEVIGKKEKV